MIYVAYHVKGIVNGTKTNQVLFYGPFDSRIEASQFAEKSLLLKDGCIFKLMDLKTL